MTFEDGVYKIINAKSPTSFLTMDTSLARQPTHVFGYPWCNKDTQKWCIKSKKGCGGYTIRNVGTNKYLGISGGASDNHDVFGMSASSSWAIKDVGKSRFRLYIEGTVFNLDLAGYGDPTPGTRVSLWGKNENNVNQCWKLEKVTSPPKPKTLTQASIRSGVYMILNIHDNNALDLSQNDYRSIITWPLHGNVNQRWHIDQLGEGYSIRSVSSGKYLTAEEGICDGAAIVANGFPVSWAISNLPGGRELDMCIRWPSQRHGIAISLVTPAITSGQNKVELQGFNWDSKWQGWRLIPVECPSVVSSTISQSRPPTLQNVTVASGGMQALHGTLNTNVSFAPEDRSTTESATVTVSEDDYSVTTTRTTVTTAVVSSVVPK